MVKTHGLTHLSLAVQDPNRSVEFYAKAFGVREYYRDEEQIQVLGPGGRLRRGEHGPGLPYAYFADRDGYEIEVWFE